VKYHPLCEQFPRLEGAKREEFKYSVGKYGVLQPSVWWNGQLIDGKNREEIAAECGKKCPRTQFEGSEEEVIEFIWAANIRRGDLTASQRAAAVLAYEKSLADLAAKRRSQGGTRSGATRRGEDVANLPHLHSEGKNGRVRDQLAEKAGVSPRMIQDAKAVQAADADIFAEVQSGHMTVNEAKKQIAADKPKSRAKYNPIPPIMRKGVEAAFDELYKRLEHCTRDIGDINGVKKGGQLTKHARELIQEAMQTVEAWRKSS
jgi:hypothetical protein